MPTFQSDGLTLAHESTGEGPPVLCIHGFASSGKVNWIDTGWVETLVGAGYRAITLDNRGHGASEKPYDPGRRDFALYLQSRASQVFQVDINPAVPMGKGIMLDHGTGLVIGETAVVGDNVSMLQNVTLGGTGKADQDRHPKIGDGVLIGAGATVLGNIRVGDCSRIGAGSVVLKEVPPRTTVAGVPAKVIGEAGCAQPALVMDQMVMVYDKP